MSNAHRQTRTWACVAVASCVLSVFVALGAASTAQAAEELPLRITEVDASDAPIIRVGLTGGEDADTGDVHELVLLEDGEVNTTGNLYAGALGRRSQYE